MTIDIIFDACTPRPLARLFPDEFRVRTAQQIGLGEISNGQLYAKAVEEGYDAFVTIDVDFAYESVIPEYLIPTFLLRGKTLLVPNIAPMVPHIVSILRDRPENRLYVIDYWEGKIIVTHSLEESNRMRKSTTTM